MRTNTKGPMRCALLCLIVFLAASSAAWAQSGSATARDSVVTEAERGFVDAFAQGDFSLAYDSIRGLQLFSDGELDSLRDQTTEQLTRAAASFGETLGWELVDTVRVGSRMEQSVYLVYYEQLPLRIRFVWYNGAESWRLYSMVWNDEVSALFEWQ